MYVRIEFNDGRPDLHMNNVVDVSHDDYILRIMYKNPLNENRLIGFSLNHVSGWSVCNDERRKLTTRTLISNE